MHTQLWCEKYLFAPCGAEIEDVAKRNATVEHLLQAQCLRTELYMIVEPLSHFPFLVFDGQQRSLGLFHHICEAAQLQAIRPDPHAAHGGYAFFGSSTPTITSLVAHCSLDDVSIV